MHLSQLLEEEDERINMQKFCKVNLEQCEAHALEPQHYVWLYLLYHKEEDRAWSLAYVQKDDLEYLERNGFIKVRDYFLEKGYNRIVLTKQTIELFETTGNDKLFEELWNVFPQKVDDGKGGYRMLRAVSLDSKDAEVCKAKYLAIIKNKPELHNYIIKCLHTQLNVERHKLMYMNGLQVWLNQKIWEKYEGFEDLNNEKVERI